MSTETTRLIRNREKGGGGGGGGGIIYTYLYTVGVITRMTPALR